MVFTVLSEQEYTAFLKHAQHNNFSQSLATKNIRTALGDTVHLVGLLHNGRIIAASLLIESAGFLGYRRFYAPRGFLF
ncbi:MAG: peptidoglycan bridge formation glycyltransferase FemA/FemB family protein, partial [Erysipelotrichaceae bacterium]